MDVRKFFTPATKKNKTLSSQLNKLKYTKNETTIIQHKTPSPKIITPSPMNAEQQTAFDLFKRRNNVFISGPAGTGKTFLIKQMYDYCKDKDVKCHVTALTGCAALLLNDCKARTLHSFCGLGIYITPQQVPGKVDWMKRKIPALYWRWKRTRVLIVDEVSMLDPTFLECIDLTAKIIRNNHSKPFGGIQVVFLGDFCQLPCIQKNKEKVFCFETPVWNELFENSSVILTQNMRAISDPTLSEMLSNIRIGNINDEFVDKLKQRIITKEEMDSMENKPIQIVPTRTLATRINKTEMDKLNTEGILFTPKPVYGDGCKKLSKTQLTKEVEKIEKNSNYIVNLSLKEGCNVMLIQNYEPEIGLVNGSMGKITRIHDNPISPKITVQFYNGHVINIGTHTWWNENETFGIKQVPLIPAYAITIHKIQGQTLDCVYANIGPGIFESGQSYVALSRVRTLENLYLSNFDEKTIFANPKVIDFYNAFN